MAEYNKYKCDLCIDMLEAYLDDTLSSSDAERFTNHIQKCSECRDELNFAQELKRELKSLEMDLPDGFEDRLHISLKTEQRGKSKFKPWMGYVIAAAAVLALTIGFLNNPDFRLNGMQDSAIEEKAAKSEIKADMAESAPMTEEKAVEETKEEEKEEEKMKEEPKTAEIMVDDEAYGSEIPTWDEYEMDRAYGLRGTVVIELDAPPVIMADDVMRLIDWGLPCGYDEFDRLNVMPRDDDDVEKLRVLLAAHGQIMSVENDTPIDEWVNFKLIIDFYQAETH